jgi:hypothetical protein
MRLSFSLCGFLLLAGIAAAQESNFSTGPQYLLPPGSPLFARSIATPTLPSNSPALEVGISSAPANTGALAYAAAAAADLPSIYYGDPTITLAENAAAQAGAFDAGVIEPGTEADEQQLAGSLLPQDYLDLGVGQATTVQDLRSHGFGLTLVETAAYWKAHPLHATRAFTNADIK